MNRTVTDDAKANFLAKRRAFQTHGYLHPEEYQQTIALRTTVKVETMGFPTNKSLIKLPVVPVIQNIFMYAGICANDIYELYSDHYIHGRNIVASVEQERCTESPPGSPVLYSQTF